MSSGPAIGEDRVSPAFLLPASVPIVRRMTAPDTAATPAIPRSLFVYAIVYGGMTVLAGMLGNKQVALGPLAVEAGIFAFLMLVVLSSTIAQLHGRKAADRLVSERRIA